MRLDLSLLSRGMVTTRERGRELIASGSVLLNNIVTKKPSQRVHEDDLLILTEEQMPWVSRSALKLLHAIEMFGQNPTGALAYDLGASKGGFTQVLLHCGAAKVYAIDVGINQLANKLIRDPRVINLEQTNVRNIDQLDLPKADWLVADMSFISLCKALPKALEKAKIGSTLIALVKPQYEVGIGGVGKSGVVRNIRLHKKALSDVSLFLLSSGWRVNGEEPSPILGKKGNKEFLLFATKENDNLHPI